MTLVFSHDVPLSLIESRLRWGALLAGIGGFVDAAGFLAIFGLFTAHMSGNSTGLGVALATGHWEEALRRGFVIPVYVAATALGVAWIELRSQPERPPASRRRATAEILAAEAVLLAVFLSAVGWVGEPVSLSFHPLGFVVAAAAATLAMGLQNAALRRVQSTGAHTTFVTGMLTELAVSGVRWLLHRRAGRDEEALRARHSTGVAGAIWCSYLVGALSGAWLVSRLGIRAVALPLILLLLVSVAEWRSCPVAVQSRSEAG